MQVLFLDEITGQYEQVPRSSPCIPSIFFSHLEHPMAHTRSGKRSGNSAQAKGTRGSATSRQNGQRQPANESQTAIALPVPPLDISASAFAVYKMVSEKMEAQKKAAKAAEDMGECLLSGNVALGLH